jgi:hypothetical protein
MSPWFDWSAIGRFIFPLAGATGWGRITLDLLVRWPEQQVDRAISSPERND